MTTTIELVRHAKAVARDGWRGRPDQDRPLTDSGHEQARALARALSTELVTALYSSPFARCVESLAPLAELADLDITADDALAEAGAPPVLDRGDAWVATAWLGGRALAFVNRVAVQHEGGRVVACSHGDVIPALMAALAGRDGLDLEDVHCPKGGRFTLQLEGLVCVRADAVTAPED